jgi:N-acetylglucosamine-6-phosphate deacetylase
VILANARFSTEDGATVRGWLRTRDGLIDAYGEGDPPSPMDPDLDLECSLLTPGFVDIHAHGAAGHSFDEATDDAVDAIVRHHRAHGTTTMLASLVSAPLSDLEDRIRALAPRVEDGTLAGLHLEGPFLSPARRGAHVSEHLRAPTAESVDRLLAAGRGTVRMITIAPELPGALDAIARIVRAGVVAAIGHTDADYETTRAAIDAGASVATHLYNGMPPIQGRAPGPVPALADDPRVTVELIADGFHLHPATFAHATRTAAGRFVLISDAIAATGVGDGDYRLGGQRIRVEHGQARLIDGDSLAGSTLTLDAALRNGTGQGMSLRDALQAVTTTPARAAGLAGRAGRIAVGRAADLVALDDRLSVRAVLCHGERIV